MGSPELAMYRPLLHHIMIGVDTVEFIEERVDGGARPVDRAVGGCPGLFEVSSVSSIIKILKQSIKLG